MGKGPGTDISRGYISTKVLGNTTQDMGQSNCPSGERIKKMWHVCTTRALLSHRRANRVICRDVDGPTVCHSGAVSQKKRRQAPYLMHICRILGNRHRVTCICRAQERHRRREHTDVWTWGEVGWQWDELGDWD